MRQRQQWWVRHGVRQLHPLLQLSDEWVHARVRRRPATNSNRRHVSRSGPTWRTMTHSRPQSSMTFSVSLGGSSVNLTAVGYQGLANTYVTLNQLISASGTVLSPSTVMTASLNGEGLATLLSDAVQNQQQSGMCSIGNERTDKRRAGSFRAAQGDLTNGPASLPAVCPHLHRRIDVCDLPDHASHTTDLCPAVDRHQRAPGLDHGGRTLEWHERHHRQPHRRARDSPDLPKQVWPSRWSNPPKSPMARSAR